MPALSAVRSLVYSARPWPALTTLTLIFGYFFSNKATSAAMPGTHVQNVSWVGLDSARAIADGLTDFAALGVPPEPPPHAASRPAAATAEPPARNRRRDGADDGRD